MTHPVPETALIQEFHAAILAHASLERKPLNTLRPSQILVRLIQKEHFCAGYSDIKDNR